MPGWEREGALDLINEGRFRVADPGPLRMPVISCSIRRNELLDLILETVCGPEARLMGLQVPDGIVRIAVERALLESPGGAKVTLIGVAPLQLHETHDDSTGQATIRVETRIHRLEGTTGLGRSPRYIIDWVGNFPTSLFVWPDMITSTTETTNKREIGGADGIRLSSSDETFSMRAGALKCSVAGMTVYLCAGGEDHRSTGYLLFDGTPDPAFRTKVRLAISLALGVYLVDLGSTTFAEDWSTVSFEAKSAYSIDRKVFRLQTKPPSPYISNTKFMYQLDHQLFNRMINALFQHHEKLDIQGLSWAYWHARCATPHIAAAHWGAALEKLIRHYKEMKPDQFPSSLIDGPAWKKLKESVSTAINALEVSETAKAAIRENVGGLNRVVFRQTWLAILEDLKISISDAEGKAWARRNDAAHGMDLEAGKELDLISDIKLLEGMFHRILVQVVGGSSYYWDYTTPGPSYLFRQIEEPPIPP
jgi:hypothetical protein